nr:MAG TPA: hypothetical protein [Caudoviricetes sp.]
MQNFKFVHKTLVMHDVWQLYGITKSKLLQL